MKRIPEIVFIYGYETDIEDREEALKEAFRMHMKELNENPRPIIDFNEV